ncbi:AlpA family phage regulatory protein [Vibrio vulnificus]|nr:AlpA family phage regulatory protein [Vibrio vulnificus]
MTSTNINPLRLMRLAEVMHMTGLSRASIYKFMEQGAFPNSVSLGARAVAWRYQDILNWVLEKIKERDDELEKRQSSNAVKGK